MWVPGIIRNLMITAYILIAGCTSSKELEAAKKAAKEAQKNADRFKTYMIIAIAAACVAVILFLVIGNIMGSKTRRDHDASNNKDASNG